MNTVSIVCLFATIVGYLLGKKFYKKYPLIIFAPGIFVPTIIIIVLVMSGVSYETYMLDAKWLIWMLGPATVAFALPIYEYRKLIQKHAFAICLGIIVGMLAGRRLTDFTGSLERWVSGSNGRMESTSSSKKSMR